MALLIGRSALCVVNALSGRWKVKCKCGPFSSLTEPGSHFLPAAPCCSVLVRSLGQRERRTLFELKVSRPMGAKGHRSAWRQFNTDTLN